MERSPTVGEALLAIRGVPWWDLVLRGIVAILFGLLALIWPAITLMALVVLFAVYAILDGVIALTALFTPEGRSRWWSFLLVGLLGIAAGIVALSYPHIAALALYIIIASWAILIGIVELGAALAGSEEMGSRWLWALSGILSLVFGVLLFAYPVKGLLAVVWLIGFWALFRGIMLIIAGFEYKSAINAATLRGATQH